MDRHHSKRRPWLAALLGSLATGLGHLYLRRWLRAAGWAALAVLASYLFVPASAIQSFAFGEPTAWVEIAPLLAVSVLSMLDAYRLAVLENYRLWLRSHDTETTPTVCPSCGRPVEEDLEFCQWCATRLDEKAA